MNARQAVEVNNQEVLAIVEKAKEFSKRFGWSFNKSVDEVIKRKIKAFGGSQNKDTAWYLRGDEAKKLN
jgi:hypothetical protein